MLISADELMKGVKVLAAWDDVTMPWMSWDLKCGLVRSKVKTLKFMRPKLQLFKELVNEIPWVTVLMNREAD